MEFRREHSFRRPGRRHLVGLVTAGVLGAVWTVGTFQGDTGLDDLTLSPSVAVTADGRTGGTVAWDLPNLDHERIDYWVDRFQGPLRDDFTEWLARTGRYGPMISEKLAERDMPQDLIYLAMIESGMNPTAYSHAHASGLWQFISETGQRYGLRVDGVVDERNDPVKATDAALDYLTYLHNRFDSWYLASAGYNTGENRVGRLMRELTGSERGTEESYYTIWPRLPRETRDYVPLMIAAARVAKEPARYGFEDVELLPPLAYDEVKVEGGVDLAAVAKAAGVDADEVRSLNPHFTVGRTPRTGSSVVRIPEGSERAFAASWDEVREAAVVATASYRVRRGDSLLRIARQHGTTVAAIRAKNGIRGDRIRAGQTLRIPA